MYSYVDAVKLNNSQVMRTMFGSLQLTVALFFTLFIIFFKRVNTMIDVVANRMFDALSQWTPAETPQGVDTLTSMSSLKRIALEQRYRRTYNKQLEKQERESQLHDVKTRPIQAASSQRRPLMGLSCFSCTPGSRDSVVSKTAQSLSLYNILKQEPVVNRHWLVARTFNHLIQAYNMKKFNYAQADKDVLKDERIRMGIESAANREIKDIAQSNEQIYAKICQKNEKRAKKILHDMRSTLSDFLLRFTSWVLYKLLPCFLTSVAVHPGQMEMIKKSAEKGLPLIFLPLHKSHLDYILITFILVNIDVKAPVVAAGDNLRIPFFGSLLRGLGAFFIKRRIDPIMGRKDYVYKSILHTYMNECLRTGHNIEFFLEGGRTRTGKPCMPKYGILSVIVEAFLDGTIEDALLVPVSVNYEKLVDGNFVREQLGQPKELETFSAALRGIWHVLNSNYGMMRLDFNQPFSMRELIKSFDVSGKLQSTHPSSRKLKSNPSTTSLYGTDIVAEEHRLMVESISKHVLYDCTNSTSVMCTNALAFLLLNRFRDGAKIGELVSALEDLKNDLLSKNRDVGFSGDLVDVINYAVDIMGPNMVKKEIIDDEICIKPITSLPNVIEMSYYSNCLAPFFALESIIGLALLPLAQQGRFISHPDLVEGCLELCDILQYEFIFCKPCQTLALVIEEAISNIVCNRDVFVQKYMSDEQMRCDRIAQECFDNDDEYEQLQKYELTATEKCQQKLQFYAKLLLPWIEPYKYTATVVEKLVGTTLSENEIVSDVLNVMQNDLQQGAVQYGESICSDPIKNALRVFQKWSYLESYMEEKVKLYSLKDPYNNFDSIRRLQSKIQKYLVVLEVSQQ